MTAYTQLQIHLQAEPKTWLITGVAGFIGSNLLAVATGVIGTAAALAVKVHVPAPVLLAVFGLLVVGHFLATRNRAAAVQRLARLRRALGALRPGARNGTRNVELPTIDDQDATDPSRRWYDARVARRGLRSAGREVDEAVPTRGRYNDALD